MIESLDALITGFKRFGARRFYAKKLSPNDNSKNQVYLGGDFSSLNILPHGEIVTDLSERAGSVRERTKAKLNLFWFDGTSKHLAPEAQLILYPKYPEIRMSGFLKKCKRGPSDIFKIRDEGRVLFLGITGDGTILGYAVHASNPLANELAQRADLSQVGVFLELPETPGTTSKVQLIQALKLIHEKRWINSQKLARDGTMQSYQARNGGGYTLEAELGISPNGYADPDFMGWEIKQYAVGNFVNFAAKTPVTLFTPEPTGGCYQSEGFEVFMSRYGYPDKSGKPGRTNFGGIYSTQRLAHRDTRLRLAVMGYDTVKNTITDIRGSIALVDDHDRVAASWQLTDLLSHWNKKHAKAAFIPSLYRTPPPQYHFGAKVLLCEGTDFLLFLAGLMKGSIFLDPALKSVVADGGVIDFKKRNQFRTRHKDLTDLYHSSEIIYIDR